MATAASGVGMQQMQIRDEDIDVYGTTHAGKVRDVNEDQFLIASLRKHMVVHGTSLPRRRFEVTGGSLAYLALVADGVGGRASGRKASGAALEALTHYVTETTACYYNQNAADESEFLADLTDTALHCHQAVRAAAEKDPEREGMATTMTLLQVIWPKGYCVQVGDSRLYHLRADHLTQTTRDQTVAQDLIDRGVLPKEKAEGSRWKNILYSALGAKAEPTTSVIDFEWNDVFLMCTDGLTKHVSDEEIRARMLVRDGAQKICKHLIDLALERGGTDNITAIVGRLRARPSGLATEEPTP